MGVPARALADYNKAIELDPTYCPHKLGDMTYRSSAPVAAGMFDLKPRSFVGNHLIDAHDHDCALGHS